MIPGPLFPWHSHPHEDAAKQMAEAIQRQTQPEIVPSHVRDQVLAEHGHRLRFQRWRLEHLCFQDDLSPAEALALWDRRARDS